MYTERRVLSRMEWSHAELFVSTMLLVVLYRVLFLFLLVLVGQTRDRVQCASSALAPLLNTGYLPLGSHLSDPNKISTRSLRGVFLCLHHEEWVLKYSCRTIFHRNISRVKETSPFTTYLILPAVPLSAYTGLIQFFKVVGSGDRESEAKPSHFTIKSRAGGVKLKQPT
jgi:hypothetical protein